MNPSWDLCNRALKGRNQLPKLIEGIKFNDGVEVNNDATNRAA